MSKREKVKKIKLILETIAILGQLANKHPNTYNLDRVIDQATNEIMEVVNGYI